jgi:hypothetical protein
VVALDVSVELSNRELQVVVAVLDTSVKEMAEAHPYGMGILDPDRERDLEELRELHDKLYDALIEAGR